MHYNPRIHYTYGGELYHYRTKGSLNGQSKYSWYRPKGQRAVGRRLPDGTYLYDTPVSGFGVNKKLANQQRANNISNNIKNNLIGTIKKNQQVRQNKALAKGSAQRDADMRAAQQQREQQRINKANNSLSGRVRNAARVASTVASKTSRNVGNWLTNRYSEARNAIGNAATGLRNRVETAWDGQAGKGSAKDQANQYARGGNTTAARDAQSRYDRSIRGRMESAGNWLTERFGAAKTAVGNAARNAYNAVSNRDEREAYEKARDNLKKNNTAENRKAYDEAKSAYQNHALTKAGRAIGDAKNSVGLAARNVGKNVTNAARSVRDNIGNAAKNARDTVANAARNAYNAVGNAWDGKAGKGSAKDDASNYDRIANHLRNERPNQIRKNMGNTNDASKLIAETIAEGNANAKKAKESRDAYDRSIVGRLDNATRGLRENIGNAARNARDTVAGAARNARNAVETAWDGQAGKGSAKDQANQYARGGNTTAARDAQSRYDRSIRGRIESAGNAIRGAADRAGRAASGAARNAYNAVSNRDEREAYEKARDNLKKNNTAENRKAYDEAKSAYQNHALTKAGRAIGDAKNSVGLAARNASKNARNAATRIGNTASGALNKATGTAKGAAGKASEAVATRVKDLGSRARKLTSQIAKTANAVSAGANSDKIFQDYSSMYVQYRQLMNSNPKEAKKLEPTMNALRKAWLNNQSAYQQNSAAGNLGRNASRTVNNFISKVTEKKKKR